MKLIINSFFVSLLILILFAKCSILKSTANKAEALTQCKFELKNVEKKVSFKEHIGNIWNYVITIHVSGINPTKENISLGNYRLDLFANARWWRCSMR